MSINKPLRVTLDTNILDLIHTPDREPEHLDPADARALRQVIADGKIEAFISEGSVFVEVLSFANKLTYLAVAGTSRARPTPDPRRVALFEDLASLGVKLMHAPLIGAEKFVGALPWAEDVVYDALERHQRFCAFASKYPRHEPLKVIGNQLLATQQPVPEGRVIRSTPTGISVELPQRWAIAIERQYAQGDGPIQNRMKRKTIGPLIGEWCDVLIMASHVGYGNDVFCTVDNGRGAGEDSLLFHGNRAALAAAGLVIRSPTELLAMIP